MLQKDMTELVNNIQKKAGEEISGIIADDLAKLIADNNSVNEQLTEKDNEIKQLNEQNKSLQVTNGNLLQQIGMGETDEEKDEHENTEKVYSFSNAFDEKGNFKK